jgi:hypothetical protein
MDWLFSDSRIMIKKEGKWRERERVFTGRLSFNVFHECENFYGLILQKLN